MVHPSFLCLNLFGSTIYTWHSHRFLASACSSNEYAERNSLLAAYRSNPRWQKLPYDSALRSHSKTIDTPISYPPVSDLDINFHHKQASESRHLAALEVSTVLAFVVESRYLLNR